MTVDPAENFRKLLHALADVYALEGRPGGDATAAAYRAAAERDDFELLTRKPYRLDHTIIASTEGARHPAAVAARAAHPLLPWSATGILEEQIPTRVSDMFAVAALIGPGALIEAENVRSGLFVQVSGAYYPLHAHNAEETYVMLAGEGEWTCGDRITRHVAGDFIHHPSNAAHATRTFARPLMACWRWSGDLSTESYRMVEVQS